MQSKWIGLVLMTSALTACSEDPERRNGLDISGVRADIFEDIILPLETIEEQRGAIHVARGMQVMIDSADNAVTVQDAARELDQGIACLSGVYPGSVHELVIQLQDAHMDSLENARAMWLAQRHLNGRVAQAWSAEDQATACTSEVF